MAESHAQALLRDQNTTSKIVTNDKTKYICSGRGFAMGGVVYRCVSMIGRATVKTGVRKTDTRRGTW